MTSLLERFSNLLDRKNSVLCIGLDPALLRQRSQNVIPAKYLEHGGNDEVRARLDFCLSIIEATAHFAIAAKPNEQYTRGFTKKDHQLLSRYIREHGLISIYDCKLGEIGDTAESNLFWIHEWGYDAITVYTQPGNLKEIVEIAHRYDPPVGIIALTLMSNKEAVKYFKESQWMGKPVYLAIAEDVRLACADGCVVGATGHVTEEDIKLIRKASGEDKVFLVPGVGAQKGDPEKVIRSGGRSILINVGRDIIYSDNPKHKASEYRETFNALRKAYLK
jgi:orotidine-5'-phosphate decarboxylase